MVGPNFKEPSTEWQASQAIFVNRSKPFDSGELAANEAGLLDLPHPDINRKKETLDKQIDEEVKKVEQEINLLKKGASEKINKIAIETTSELLVKLIGTEVNNSSISAIVDDLSKRNGDKYYGN